MNIRLSIGSAILLGLSHGKIDALPTTIYTMLGEGCVADCRFCAQARNSRADKKFLSRVIWPEFELDDVLNKIDDKKGCKLHGTKVPCVSKFEPRRQAFSKVQICKRICVQTLKYPKLLDDLVYLVSRVKERTNIPISACVNPLDKKSLKRLKDANLDRIGVGLDCASENVFRKMKPDFKWDDYMNFMKDMVDVFGTGSVHLIVGLGETDEEMISMFQKTVDMKCYPALFAFTPVKGINLGYPKPEIERYRALQLARYLITNKLCRIENMVFENGKMVSIKISSSILENVLESGKPFQTSGCKDCNRPFYNERPGGIMYNYPYPLDKDEVKNVKEELRGYGLDSS